MLTFDTLGVTWQGLQGAIEQLGSTVSAGYAMLAARWRYTDTQRLLNRTLSSRKPAPTVEAARVPVDQQFDALARIVEQGIEHGKKPVDDHARAHVKLDAAEYAWTQLLDELGTVMPQFSVQTSPAMRLHNGTQKPVSAPSSQLDRLAA